MIAELAAANAAFDVVKQSIQNGKEIYEAGEALAEYFGLKNEIQKKAHEHGYKSDLQAFMATEKLRAQEEELKELMIWQGRGGMWQDWLKFQVEMRKSREEEEREKLRAKLKRRQILINTLILSSSIAGAIALFAAFVYILITYGR